MHTRTTTDSDGNTRTETYTVQHDEPIVEVYLNRPFGELAVNMKARGEKVRFESLAFNRAFKVRSVDRKFAYDVIHPLQMDFLTAYGPAPFCIDTHGRICFQVGENNPQIIAHCANFAHGFLGRVPSFVWKNLGVTQGEPEVPTFREVNA